MKRILHTSDLHCTPAAFKLKLERHLAIDWAAGEYPDLVVVTGDMVPNFFGNKGKFNRELEAAKQRVDWLKMVDILEETLPQSPIVAVPGNHDFCDYGVEGRVESFDSTTPHSREIDGIKLAGFSGVPYIFSGFWRDEMNDRSMQIQLSVLKEVGKGSVIVMTHGPPLGVLDRVHGGEQVGIPGMQDVLEELGTVQLHLFGHIHEAEGTVKVKGIRYSNAATTFRKVELE